ncbi:nuclear transport factor 2 family protein [Oryzihumus sp.]
MDVAGFASWVAGYERAWRAPGTDLLATLFADDAAYLMSPYADPVVGLEAISELWEAERDGPEEVFTMTSQVVAFSGDTGVARVHVVYGAPYREWRDIWIVRFDGHGRAVHFEEWPIGPPGSHRPSGL